jgi:hypothetical protein
MIIHSPNHNFEFKINTEFGHRSTCGSTVKVIREKEVTNRTSKGVREGRRLTGAITEHEH